MGHLREANEQSPIWFAESRGQSALFGDAAAALERRQRILTIL